MKYRYAASAPSDPLTSYILNTGESWRHTEQMKWMSADEKRNQIRGTVPELDGVFPQWMREDGYL